MIRSYKDLQVYQESYQLALRVYKISQGYPPEERYGLTGQTQKASVSIPLNIAEGYGKQDSAAEFKRYLRMALGSVNEMLVLLDFSRDLGYIGNEAVEDLQESYGILAKRIYQLIERWKR